MRVAFVLPFLRRPSGWRSASLGVIGSLEESGVEPLLAVSEADRRAANELLPGREILVLPEVQFMAFGSPRSWGRLACSWRQARRAHLPKVDLVHSLEGYPSGLVGHWLASGLNVGHIVTAIGTYSVQWHNRFPDRWAYQAVLGSAAAVCPISEGTADRMRRHFPRSLAASRVKVLHLGCDAPERVPREVAEAPRSGGPIVLSVGGVKQRKGYDVCIEAFAAIRREIPTAQYRIVGSLQDGDYVEALKSRIASLNLEGVKFLGEVSAVELDRRYREASLFWLAPRQSGRKFEGFGMVFLEAGAYGLPVVATRSGGVADAIDHEKTGFLCPPEDSSAFADAGLRLLGDPELSRRMGVANRVKAEGMSWERFAAEQMQIYRETKR